MPQFAASVMVSAQPVGQYVRPVVQVHALFAQVVLTHAFAQRPQWAAFVTVSTH